MWQRFTERARRVILLAQEEARNVNSPHVGTEHLLLGLIREEEGVTEEVFKKTGIALGQVREAIESELSHGTETSTEEPKLTPKAKRVLELAADEARQMRHDYIGTEHFLLALLREHDGLAAMVLKKLGLNLGRARIQVAEYLGPGGSSVTRTVTAVTRAHFDVSFSVQLALDVAAQIAGSEGHPRIEISHLVLALLHKDDDLLAHTLQNLGVNLDELRAQFGVAKPTPLPQPKDKPKEPGATKAEGNENAPDGS